LRLKAVSSATALVETVVVAMRKSKNSTGGRKNFLCNNVELLRLNSWNNSSEQHCRKGLADLDAS
jgi:hypothetical protein